MRGFAQYVVVGWSAFSISVGVLFLPSSLLAAGGTGPIVFLDLDGNVVRGVDFTTSYNSTTYSLKIRVNTDIALAMLVNQSWVESRVPDIALENVSFSLRTWDSRSWYEVGLKPDGITFLDLHPFQPLKDRPLFSRGSASSLLLERAMFIRLQAVPTELTVPGNGSNSNGTWSCTATRTEGPLVLNLTDRNTTGQTVRLNGAWLSSLGISQPSFLLSGGEDVPFEKIGNVYVLRPRHFSLIYAFAGDEHFRKETDFQYSEVYWDQGAQNVFLRSDRRDTGDEWFSRPLPQEIDSTTDFTLSSTWTPTAQGNYQIAMPLFLASSRDVSALQPSGLYFWYYGRNGVSAPPCSDCSPLYYLFYYDRTGTARIYDLIFEGGRNVPYKPYATYSAITKILTMQIRSTADAVLHSVSYTIGTNAGDDFFFGKIGVGSEDPPVGGAEPVAEGAVDNIRLTLGSIANPSVELDTNGDSVPDGWHNVWWYASRSYEYRHSGAWSIKIDDPSAINGGGMETDDMPGIPGRYYRAIAYSRVQSGSFQLSLKFLDQTGAQVGIVTMGIGTTDSYWRRIYVDGVAPPGTASIRVMAWTLTTNVGTAYFDSFYLIDSRLDNAGFEEAMGARPTHWTGVGGGVPTVDQVHVRSGTYSLRLVDSSALDWPGVRSDLYPCVPGARYRAAAWLYVESTSVGGSGYPFTLHLNFWNGEGEGDFLVDGGAVNAWDYLAVEAFAPSGCAAVSVQFLSGQANVGVADMDDVELLLAPSGLETDSSIWAITAHGTPGATDTLGPTSDLGVGHERRDWVWWFLEPSLDFYDWNAVGLRRTYLRTASQVGIDVVVIVGGSLGDNPLPSGVTDANFASAWYHFCEFVGREFGASVYWYQLANEQNTGHGRFDSTTVFTQCSNGLEYGEAPYSFFQSFDHTWFFRSIVNSYESTAALEDWLIGAGQAIDVIALDHYPGQPGAPFPDSDWSIMNSLSILARTYGKLAAIMETGRGTGILDFCDENCQANWILNNLRDQMRPKVVAQNTDYYNNRYVLLGFYDLQDGGDSFGLIRTDGSHKPAYATFQAEAYNYVLPPFYS